MGCTTIAGAVHEEVPTLVRARPLRDSPSPDGTKLASYPGPSSFALRANPFSEGTDLICRLPLPTLFYRLEAVHLGDLLRIWVRSGTRIKSPHSDFQGPTEALRTPQEPWRFAGTTSISLAEPIPWSPSLNKKRKLLSGPLLTSPSSFALPHWVAVTGTSHHSPCPGSGILTRCPFGQTVTKKCSL